MQSELLRVDAPWNFIHNRVNVSRWERTETAPTGLRCKEMWPKYYWSHVSEKVCSPPSSSFTHSVRSLWTMIANQKKLQHRRNLSAQRSKKSTYFKSSLHVPRNTTFTVQPQATSLVLTYYFTVTRTKFSSLFPEVFLRDSVNTQPELWKSDSQFSI